MTFINIKKLRLDLGRNCELWMKDLPGQLSEILSHKRHGHLNEWQSIISALPDADVTSLDLDSDCIRVGNENDLETSNRNTLISLLKQLHPWRKGPYQLFGIPIDTEWRSDWKWSRLKEHIAPLVGKSVLDVGCGSGYHCWRMRGAGAGVVVGIDPMIRFLTQFTLMKRYIGEEPVHLLPLTLEQMPDKLAYFDTVFSLGVLYHRRSPIDHLYDLYDCMAPGGQLVLETLVIEGENNAVLIPDGRYAKMRNVWFIVDVSLILSMLNRCGFKNPRVVDVTTTTVEEQRRTEWMTFESLADFLDPLNSALTIEGHPAPVRAIFIADKPMK